MGGRVPNKTECMTISSVIQCHAINTAIKAVMVEPATIVVDKDLSNVKTRWMTVAVAMSIERSSPGLCQLKLIKTE